MNHDQREWQVRQKEVKGYDVLEQRHDALQNERMKRLDQRLMDDFAARAYTAKG